MLLQSTTNIMSEDSRLVELSLMNQYLEILEVAATSGQLHSLAWRELQMLPLSEYPDLLRRYETALAMIEQIQQPKHPWKQAMSNWITNAKEAICTVLNSEPVTGTR
jgi:hypothetical protein